MTDYGQRSLRDAGGEDALLALVRPILERHTAGLLLGTGDDVAITPPLGHRTVWTIDTMVEGTHFRWWDHPAATPERLAQKLVAMNTSDLNAKAAQPRYGLLSLGLPGTAPIGRIRRFFHGLDTAMVACGAALIGGDIVRSPQWSLTLTLVGELADGLPIAARHGAGPGWLLYVTGQPGRARLGLEILDRGLQPPGGHHDALLNAFLAPEPPLDLGPFLASHLSQLAMMDLSDGLATDLGRLAEQSGLQAVLEEAHLPAAPSVAETVKACSLSLREILLAGGEDYDLLLATPTPPTELEALRRQLPPDPRYNITPIGELRSGSGAYLATANGQQIPLKAAAFQHFS